MTHQMTITSLHYQLVKLVIVLFPIPTHGPLEFNPKIAQPDQSPGLERMSLVRFDAGRSRTRPVDGGRRDRVGEKTSSWSRSGTYVTVTSFNPVEAFIYKDGFARFTTVPYNTNDEETRVQLVGILVLHLLDRLGPSWGEIGKEVMN